VKALLCELIPHAPNLGLYVRPDIPAKKLSHAVHSYGETVSPDAVIVLFDTTAWGRATYGALFTEDRVRFQNDAVRSTHTVRYRDVVDVRKKTGLLSKKISLGVNRGRATFTVELDGSNRRKALEYIYHFLCEVMVLPPQKTEITDWDAVRTALQKLCDQGLLTTEDYRRMLPD